MAVTAFTVASTPRMFDRQSGEWKDGDTLFLRCSAWRNLAEHVTETLTRGTRVIVTGRLRQRDYENREGNKRTSYEIDVDEVGPSLRYATAKVVKATRQHAPHRADTPNDNSGGFGHGRGPDGDPWQHGGAPTGQDAGNGFSPDPPF